MSLRLSALEGEQTIDVRPGTTLVVGRSPACDAPVIDGTVSRRHAELVADEAGGEVRDLGSSNGTYVNDARVERAALAAGDVVRFGKVRFRVGPMPEPVDPRVAPTTPLSAAAVRGTRTVMRPCSSRRPPPTRRATTPAWRKHAPESREQRLRTLLEVSKQLTQAASVDALLAKIVDVCFRTFDVDRVALMLGVTADALTPKLARDRAGRALEGMVPLSIARSAVAERAGILSDDAPRTSDSVASRWWCSRCARRSARRSSGATRGCSGCSTSTTRRSRTASTRRTSTS
jgi:pSer/pThr/pTyr-binding forkhead associated (FHA) protein